MTMVKTANLTVIDPVCGMEVDPGQAPRTRMAMGQTFYFCSNFCAEIFDPDIDAIDLVQLRAAITGTGHRSRPALALRARGVTKVAVNKLIHFFGGE